MENRNWINQFGLGYQVPVEVTNLVEKGLLEDCSWVNSTSPNFVHCGMELWVEHPDAHQRQRWLDCETETSRYLVQVFPDNDGLREHVTLYEGGSIIMALAAMGFTPDEWASKLHDCSTSRYNDGINWRCSQCKGVAPDPQAIQNEGDK